MSIPAYVSGSAGSWNGASEEKRGGAIGAALRSTCAVRVVGWGVSWNWGKVVGEVGKGGGGDDEGHCCMEGLAEDGGGVGDGDGAVGVGGCVEGMADGAVDIDAPLPVSC